MTEAQRFLDQYAVDLVWDLVVGGMSNGEAQHFLLVAAPRLLHAVEPVSEADTRSDRVAVAEEIASFTQLDPDRVDRAIDTVLPSVLAFSVDTRNRH